MSKKIGIFTGYFLPHMGGVQRYVDKLSSALANLGYEIVIVTSNDDLLDSYEKTKNYSLYRLPILNIFKKRYPIPLKNQEYAKIINKIEKEKIDLFIVNTRFHLTSLIGAKMGNRNKKPVILIEHGTDHFTVNNKILDFFGHIYEHLLTNIIKKYVDKYYGVSKKCNLWSEHFSINASGVFYNAIDSSDILNVSDYYDNIYSKGEITITYAGRLIKEKGILNLIEAFNIVSGEYPKKKTKLVVAGDGDLLDTIKYKFREKNIDILGKLDFNSVMSLYKRTDIFVYPSLYPEGLPTSILEAGLMNCAIIATPKGGTEEVITNGTSGIIINGDVNSLCDALRLLISDESIRKSQAKKAKENILKNFEWKNIAKIVDKEIKEFYKK